jgi:hypothetical protein
MSTMEDTSIKRRKTNYRQIRDFCGKKETKITRYQQISVEMFKNNKRNIVYPYTFVSCLLTV